MNRNDRPQNENNAAANVNATGKPDSFAGKSNWFLVLGACLTIIGFLAILFPLITTLATEMLIGCVLLMAGAVYVLHVFNPRWNRWENFFWSLGWGLLYSVAGILLLASPWSGIFTLTLCLAALFFIEGVSKLIAAIRAPKQFGKWWIVADGFISIALATLVFIAWPRDATWVIGILVGLRLVFTGMLLVGFGAVTWRNQPWEGETAAPGRHDALHAK